jgi:hypothetical protein
MTKHQSIRFAASTHAYVTAVAKREGITFTAALHLLIVQSGQPSVKTSVEVAA